MIIFIHLEYNFIYSLNYCTFLLPWNLRLNENIYQSFESRINVFVEEICVICRLGVPYSKELWPLHLLLCGWTPRRQRSYLFFSSLSQINFKFFHFHLHQQSALCKWSKVTYVIKEFLHLNIVIRICFEKKTFVFIFLF